MDNEKRAYKHEIWSYQYPKKASNNRSFWRILRAQGVNSVTVRGDSL